MVPIGHLLKVSKRLEVVFIRVFEPKLGRQFRLELK
jgi:hypothetical protein